MKNMFIVLLVFIRFFSNPSAFAEGSNTQDNDAFFSAVLTTTGLGAASAANFGLVSPEMSTGSVSLAVLLALLFEYAIAEDKKKDKTSLIVTTRELHGLSIHSFQASSGYEKGQEEGKVVFEDMDIESLRQTVYLSKEDAKDFLTTGVKSTRIDVALRSIRELAEKNGFQSTFNRFSDRDLGVAILLYKN